MRAWLGALCCAAACSSGPALGDEALRVSQIAPGLFVHVGEVAESSPSNHGDIANVGFIVGSRCVAVIDTGGSAAVGRALRAAVRTVTAAPICYVVNTHVHPDHVLGNAAFLADHPEFVGHAKLAAAMNARGPSYLAGARRALGEEAREIELVPPTREVRASEVIDLGDRRLLLRAWPTAHTDNDLTVFDVRTGTLWLADLLFVEHIPVLDGSLPGWLRVLAELLPSKVERVVPGHGPASVDWPQAGAEEERYLQRLLADTRTALRGKRTLQEAVDTVGTDERDRWALFDAFHRRNVTAAFAELEWEE